MRNIRLHIPLRGTSEIRVPVPLPVLYPFLQVILEQDSFVLCRRLGVPVTWMLPGPYPLVMKDDQVMLTFQPGKRFRTVFRPELPADPPAVVKWIRVPGKPGGDAPVPVLLWKNTPPGTARTGHSSPFMLSSSLQRNKT